MTEQWQIERDDERLANLPVPTDADILADAYEHADALTAQIDVLTAKQAAMRELADSIPARQRSLEGYERAATTALVEAERADLAGDAEAAMAAAGRARDAQNLLAMKTPALEATIAQVDEWPFADNDEMLEDLAMRRNLEWERIADPGVRADAIMDVIDTIQAAKARKYARAERRLKTLNDTLNPRLIAEQVHAEGQAKIAEKEARREHSAPVPAPPKPSSNAAVVALERMRDGRRVAPGVVLGIASTGGPAVPARTP